MSDAIDDALLAMQNAIGIERKDDKPESDFQRGVARAAGPPGAAGASGGFVPGATGMMYPGPIGATGITFRVGVVPKTAAPKVESEFPQEKYVCVGGAADGFPLAYDSFKDRTDIFIKGATYTRRKLSVDGNTIAVFGHYAMSDLEVMLALLDGYRRQ